MKNTGRKNWWMVLPIMAIGIIGFFLDNIQPGSLKPMGDNLGTDDSYYTVRDESGRIILETGLPVHVDDEYYDEINNHYVITGVRGSDAIAVLQESPQSGNGGGAVIKSMLPQLNQAIPAQVLESDIKVGIYHTHSDECYFPTSKKLNRPGDGDIFRVGAALADALTNQGLKAVHSKNPHDPHDINAYHRSRKTAAKLMKEEPDILIDVHRDAAPAQAYQTTLNGIATTKVMIVIGRSNPTRDANLEFAKQIKATADELYPGLLRGIFMGKGNYNQDLHPKAILFEVGTAGNYQLSAERAVRALADVIIEVVRKQN